VAAEKRIGKIQAISFGKGGYQDAMIGISVSLGSDKECWGVWDFRGEWAIKRSDHCMWTENDRITRLGEMCMWANGLLETAKVQSIADLKGKPVEVTFDGNLLKSWRLLEEAL
jgi:hypothetical protein